MKNYPYHNFSRYFLEKWQKNALKFNDYSRKNKNFAIFLINSARNSASLNLCNTSLKILLSRNSSDYGKDLY